MTAWITVALMAIGSAFAFLAAIGIVRLPDLFTRMHAISKSASLGVGCILLAVAVHFGELGITTRALLVIAFVLLTVPISAHFIARAAYVSGVQQWEGTIIDELHGATGDQQPLGRVRAVQSAKSDEAPD